MSAATAPAIYADCLFNTSLLPATITVGPNTYNKNVPGASINGATWNATDPEDQAQFVSNINLFISFNYYGTSNSVYQSTGPNATVKPCRYVVMHSNAQNPPQAAHQLLVDGSGNATFITTNWTS